jgi:osmotically inducible protein OsmC
MKRRATAVWSGSGKEGDGHLSGPSGVLNETPYSALTRFKNEDGKAGTNPEELIAAAHAGCFTMALSFGLSGAGFPPEKLATKATVTIEAQEEGGFAITHIQLDLRGKVDGIDEAQFIEFAEGAKKGCPVSKALSAVPMDLDITFEK